MNAVTETVGGTLLGGYVDEAGTLYRRVVVAPLTGRDEELFFSARSQAGPELTTALVSCCARFTDGLGDITQEVARKLLIADRQYVLMMLREATQGSQVLATVTCTNGECGAKIDIDFGLKDVPVVESADKGRTHRMELSESAAFQTEGGERHRSIVFRLPDGEDQEVVAPLLARSEMEAAEALLARCILAMGPDVEPGLAGVRRLSSLARAEIETRMEAAAPSIALTMEGVCPECSHEFAVPFDIQEFLLSELRGSNGLLYREVHYLAYHYHWSEREIMEMPREKRRRYIEVLSDEIERLNNAVAW